MARAQALCALHAETCAQAASPPAADDGPSPFRAGSHTPEAILCGDFNLEPGEPEHAAIQAPFGPERFHDAWPLVHGAIAHSPTFRLFDRTYGAEPIACDFVFASGGLAPRLQRIEVDSLTQASDHQPLLVVL